jgi:1-phosphofructokinase family hexose kinase
MASMFATLTLNPSLDKTLYINELALDDSNRCARFRYDPGGKGLNISRVLWELGKPSLLFGFLGGETGRRVEKYLRDEGLTCDFNWTSGETRENLILTTIDEPIQQTKINLPGPAIREDEVHRLKRKLAGRTREYHTLVLSGSVPPGVSPAIYKEIALESMLRGDRVVLDADGEAFREGLKARPFMIKPNLHELQRLMGRPLEDDKAIHAALDELLDTVELIVLTRGHGQVLAATRDERLVATPPEVEARTSVGAGDSLIAGFLYAYEGPSSLAQALRYGVATGTACVISPGTELAHLADVQRLLDRVHITEAAR